MEIAIEERDVWGPNFKVRCGVCLASSGWVSLRESNEWWRTHHFASFHMKMAKFIRKIVCKF